MELNNQVSDQDTNNSVVSEETVKNPEAVLAKNRELLNEKKQMAQKIAEFESRFKEISDQKLMAEGKKDELIKSLRDENREVKERLSKTQHSYQWTTVSNQIKEAAVAKGCKDPNALLKLLSDDDLNAIEVDENFSVNTEDLNRVLDKASKQFSNIKLFGSDVKVDDIIPSNTIKTKSTAEMSRDELKEQLLNS